jgi:hypothetical protein
MDKRAHATHLRAMTSRDDDRTAEAKAALKRVARDSETIGTSALARQAKAWGDHFAGRDAPADDPAELWGRRIGRALSLVGVVVLGWYVGTLLKLW